MKTHEEKMADFNAASAALAKERAAIERDLNLRVAIKLAQHVRAVGTLPGNAPQCLGALVALLEEIERLTGCVPPVGIDEQANALAPKHPYPALT